MAAVAHLLWPQLGLAHLLQQALRSQAVQHLFSLHRFIIIIIIIIVIIISSSIIDLLVLESDLILFLFSQTSFCS